MHCMQCLYLLNGLVNLCRETLFRLSCEPLFLPIDGSHEQLMVRGLTRLLSKEIRNRGILKNCFKNQLCPTTRLFWLRALVNYWQIQCRPHQTPLPPSNVHQLITHTSNSYLTILVSFRDDWHIGRASTESIECFLAVVWFGSSPPSPTPLPPVQ